MANTQPTPACQLDAIVKRLEGDQHHLLISSFVPSACWADHRVRFSGILSTDELLRLREAIDGALNLPA